MFDFREMTTSAEAVVTDVVRDARPVAGYACAALMRACFIPHILRAPLETLLDPPGRVFDPARALEVMLRVEQPGGHTEGSIAFGTIEVARWDALAKIEDCCPRARCLADRYCAGRLTDLVSVYVGGGWYRPGQTVRDLQDEMRAHVDVGYRRVKTKVGGLPLPEDCRRIEAVLRVLPPGVGLVVDATARFGREGGLAYADALAPHGLRRFEEPCDPPDFALHAEVVRRYPHPVVGGENRFSTPQVRNLVTFGGLRAGRDIVRIDRAAVMLAKHGWSRSWL